jgi:hypothetical protein
MQIRFRTPFLVITGTGCLILWIFADGPAPVLLIVAILALLNLIRNQYEGVK